MVRHASPSHITSPHLQADIAARVAAKTANASPPWHVVGHSFGGEVALDLAVQRPGLVSALTISKDNSVRRRACWP